MWQAYLKLNFRVCTICLQFDYVFLLKSNFSYHLQTSNPKTRQTIRNPNQMPGLHQIHWGTSNPEPETQTEARTSSNTWMMASKRLRQTLAQRRLSLIRGFPKLGLPCCLVPLMRILAFWGVNWGLPYFGKLPSLQLC